MDSAQKPAGHPPPGVHSNFLNPVSLREPVIAVNTSFVILAALAVVLRLYAKAVVTQATGWDDC